MQVHDGAVGRRAVHRLIQFPFGVGDLGLELLQGGARLGDVRQVAARRQGRELLLHLGGAGGRLRQVGAPLGDIGLRLLVIEGRTRACARQLARLRFAANGERQIGFRRGARRSRAPQLLTEFALVSLGAVELGLELRLLRLKFLKLLFERLRIDTEQNLPLLDRGVRFDRHFDHATGDARRDLDDVVDDADVR
ncbi:hypothetical protein D3C80_1494050 [compost metagenome]